MIKRERERERVKKKRKRNDAGLFLIGVRDATGNALD